ncbi:hypothetical protein B0J13DRAFT_567070 [Dactylonectria estremocensis]|uniref:Uncharacterized protein n=1 Tax=Dactylonectria estremocensis TaxID=1079267 RepID=A0A9P9DNI2_9HYPO|nr:hypothetical protein B0J13DRAFT_567070 [Dactylonectria estremocensis]
MLVLKVMAEDFTRLLGTPTREIPTYWTLGDEFSLWSGVTTLKPRCVVENELDRPYQVVRKLRLLDCDERQYGGRLINKISRLPPTVSVRIWIQNVTAIEQHVDAQVALMWECLCFRTQPGPSVLGSELDSHGRRGAM